MKTTFCFLYSILAHIHPKSGNDHPNRVAHYRPFLHELNYTGLTFPLKIRQIKKFEDQNPQISVNVLYNDEDTSTVMPIRVTNHRGRQHHVNLFLLYDDGKVQKNEASKHSEVTDPGEELNTEVDKEEEVPEPEPKFHYTLVRNLSALIRRNTKSTGTLCVCPYCLHIFHNNGNKYKTHVADCVIHKPQVIYLPDPKDDKANHVSFKNVFKTFPVQFCLYLDFECFLNESNESLKNVQQVHEVSGFCMLRVSTEPSLNKCEPFLYSGTDVMDVFYNKLEQEHEEIDFYLRTNLPMEPLTATEQKLHDEATECQQCHKPFDDTRSLRKCRHHLHLTGKYEKNSL